MAANIAMMKVAFYGLAILGLASLGNASPAAAQTRYDGAWSVVIITDAGSCDRAYRYGLRIERGRILYDGGGVDVRGRVTNSGSVSVTLRQGDSYAVGSGRLTRNTGSGRWRGASQNNRCSGHWQAQRQ